MSENKQFFDVVVVGAGLSGVGAAFHLHDKCPKMSFTVLEGRANIGGTWDLFKYPGIRSDSDMYTFGFSFFPWKNPKAIADGPSILEYINETVDAFDLRKHIQFNKKVVVSNWNSNAKNWTLEIFDKQSGETEKIECKFLFMCSGYYNYERGYEPEFPHFDNFKGIKIHPQKWDETLDYADKNVVIIGSGATAVTLLPKLAEKAKNVTMLQRSPTYIMNLPAEDRIANFFKKILPANAAHQISRWKNILLGLGLYQISRKYPNFVKKFLKKSIKKQLGEVFEEKHFTPKYNPWDQRLCLVPDNDLFLALKSGKGKIVTDTIKTFAENKIELNSGEVLDADIIVTATGLNVQLFGGMKLMIDSNEIETSSIHAYKGVMFSGIPNFAVSIGYTNASWTLKCDLNCFFVTRVLNYMKQNNYEVCVPEFDHENLSSERFLDFDANYILRAEKILPKQGSKAPWKVYQNYLKDVFALKYGSITDEYLVYK
ncbi:MAG TPA: NAD(P)/FAD-dependent oxidoreductase [Pyrinomonadaceae bacterium]|nr:NAD(P)/FAD-dependent oxidoreductase [Pyrinomonadaceae bacterium]